MRKRKKILSCLMLVACLIPLSLSSFFLAPSRADEAQAPFTDSGTASWFGRWHHGKRTASGEPFDMYAMTAAHRTLPFGTVLQVTHLKTGREILVRVNDRGPYRKRRILDLSYAAAECLGMRVSGVAQVEIKAVGDTDGLPLDANQAFFVRLDEERSNSRAERKLAGLIRAGFPKAADLLYLAGDAVALGPFDSFQEAQETLLRVSTIHPKAAIMLAERDGVKPVVSTQAAN